MPEQRVHNPLRGVVVFVLISGPAIALAHASDPFTQAHLCNIKLATSETGRMFRMAGFAPSWLMVAWAFYAIDRRRDSLPITCSRWTRGTLLLATTITAGLLAELLKLVVRRHRPVIGDSVVYSFRPYTEYVFNTTGLGMPSSHAAVAFGAAFILVRLHPAGSLVWLALAVGCAATRILVQAHFLSDTVAAALLGYSVAWMYWGMHRRVAARRIKSASV